MNEGDTTAIDVEDVIRYFVVHNFVVNDDSYTGTMIHNYYLYEENGILSMIPWDYNLAYGTFQGGNAASSVNRDIFSPVTGGMDDRPMVKWIFESEAYTDQYKAYFEEFLKTVNAAQIIEDARAIIAPYVEKDPTKFCTYEEFETGVSALETFVELRSQSVSNQLSGTNETVSTTGFNASDMGTMGDKGGRQNRQMHEMPIGWMGAMPGGFTPSGMSGAEIPNETPAPDKGAQGEPQNTDSDTETSAASAENTGESQPTRKNRTGMTGANPFSNASGTNSGNETGSNGAVLLVASICVLLASIAIAFFTKH